jgi:hypothetical protein
VFRLQLKHVKIGVGRCAVETEVGLGEAGLGSDYVEKPWDIIT